MSIKTGFGTLKFNAANAGDRNGILQITRTSSGVQQIDRIVWSYGIIDALTPLPAGAFQEGRLIIGFGKYAGNLEAIPMLNSNLSNGLEAMEIKLDQCLPGAARIGQSVAGCLEFTNPFEIPEAVDCFVLITPCATAGTASPNFENHIVALTVHGKTQAKNPFSKLG